MVRTRVIFVHTRTTTTKKRVVYDVSHTCSRHRLHKYYRSVYKEQDNCAQHALIYTIRFVYLFTY